MQTRDKAVIIAIALAVSFVVSGCAAIDHLTTPPGFTGEGERMQRQAARILARTDAAAAPAKQEAPKPPTIAEQVRKLEDEVAGLRKTVVEQTAANAKLTTERDDARRERDTARAERDKAREERDAAQRERDTAQKAGTTLKQRAENAEKLVPGTFIERSRLFGRDVLIYEAPPPEKK